MWEQPATQRNVATIEADGRVQFVGPVHGEVASGEQGMGRMAEPDVIATAILALCGPRDLAGRHIVVTAGPTVEDLDPARFLSNRSSGKMGFAVAERAAARGAKVSLIAGPVALPTPYGVIRIDVRSALQMQQALWTALGTDLDKADGLVMAAAVADYRPVQPRPSKMKKSADQLEIRLRLTANPDLLAEIGEARSRPQPFLVGFALETESGAALLAAAQDKLEAKRVDMVVANCAADAFDGESNVATLVTAKDAEVLDRMPKRRLADRILDRVAASWSRS